MGWYKVWSGNREQKKSVKAESMEEILQKGADKLGIARQGVVAVDASDGTEIDDIQMLAEMSSPIILLLQPGQSWTPLGQTPPPSSQVVVPQPASEPQTHAGEAALSLLVNGVVQQPAQIVEPLPSTSPVSEDTETSLQRRGSFVIAEEITRAPLPQYGKTVIDALKANEPGPIWNLMLRQAAEYYYKSWPEMDDSSLYRIIGQKMAAAYPSIKMEGAHSWSLFNRGLSSRICHFRCQDKNKSAVAGQGATGAKNRPCFKPAMPRSSQKVQNVVSPEDAQLHVQELKKEWAKPEKNRNTNHIKLIIQQTTGHRAALLAKDETGRVAPIIDVYPCFEDGYFVTHAFKTTIGADRAADAASKLGHVIRATEKLMGRSKEGRLRMLPVIQYLEKGSQFDRVEKAKKMKSIIDIHEDVPDGQVASLLATQPGEPLHLVAFLLHGKLSGLFIVGDTAIIKVASKVRFIEGGVYTLIAAYYTFNVNYPPEYAMLLGLLQCLVLQEQYTKPTSKRWALLVAKIRRAMEDCPETSDDEGEQPNNKKTAEQIQAALEADPDKTTAKAAANKTTAH